MLIQLFEQSIIIAIIAFVYAELLIQPGEILSNYWQFIRRLFEDDYPMAFKMLGNCTKCFAGQIAFWYGVYCFIFNGGDVLFHFLLVFLSIFVAYIFSKTNEYYKG